MASLARWASVILLDSRGRGRGLDYIVGGGTAEVRLPDESRATSPTPQFLKQVGLPDRPDKQ
jgi:hypothetical protein